MNPYAMLAMAAAIALAAAGGYKVGVDHEVASRAREDKHITEAVEAATAVSAKAIADLRPKYTTIQGKLEKQIETNTVYRDCRIDSVGMQLANQALDPRAAATAGGKLPSADTTPK